MHATVVWTKTCPQPASFALIVAYGMGLQDFLCGRLGLDYYCYFLSLLALMDRLELSGTSVAPISQV